MILTAFAFCINLIQLRNEPYGHELCSLEHTLHSVPEPLYSQAAELYASEGNEQCCEFSFRTKSRKETTENDHKKAGLSGLPPGHYLNHPCRQDHFKVLRLTCMGEPGKSLFLFNMSCIPLMVWKVFIP